MADIKLNSSSTTQATITRNHFQTLNSIKPLAFEASTPIFEKLKRNHTGTETRNNRKQ